MPDTQPTDRRPAPQPPDHPPFHVILSYLLGAWADLRVANPDRTGRPGQREPRS